MKQPLLWLSLFLGFLTVSGCSIIGFGLGSAIDDATPDYGERVAGTLEEGDSIRITRNDLTIIEGVHRGSEPLDPSTYDVMYSEFLNNVEEGLNLPTPGDTLLRKTSDTLLIYVFRGYGATTLNLEQLPEHAHATLPFTELTYLERFDGKTFDIYAYKRTRAAGLLPFNESIVVESGGETFHVPINDIKHIEQPRAKIAKWIGLGMGLVVDIAVVTGIFKALGDAFGTVFNIR